MFIRETMPKILRKSIEILDANAEKNIQRAPGVAKAAVQKLDEAVIGGEAKTLAGQKQTDNPIVLIYREIKKAIKEFLEARAAKKAEIAAKKPVATAKAEAPKAQTPKVEAPKVEAPKVEAPKVEAPKVEAPKAEAPKVAKKSILSRVFGKKEKPATANLAKKLEPIEVAKNTEIKNNPELMASLSKPMPKVEVPKAPKAPKVPSKPISERISSALKPAVDGFNGLGFVKFIRQSAKNFKSNRATVKAAENSFNAANATAEELLRLASKVKEAKMQTLEYKMNTLRPQASQALKLRREIFKAQRKADKAIGAVKVSVRDAEIVTPKLMENVKNEGTRVGTSIVNTAKFKRLNSVSDILYRFQDFTPSVLKLDEEQFRRTIDRVDVARAVTSGSLGDYANAKFTTGTPQYDLLHKIDSELSKSTNEIAKAKLTSKLVNTIIEADKKVKIAEAKQAAERAIAEINADSIKDTSVNKLAGDLKIAEMTKDEKLTQARAAYRQAKDALYARADVRRGLEQKEATSQSEFASAKAIVDNALLSLKEKFGSKK